MTVYQAPAKVPANKELIMFDFLETIVDCTERLKGGEKFVPREGIEDLLKYFKQENKKIVIVSDSRKKDIKKHLNGLGKYFDNIYGKKTTKVINNRGYKNLSLPCEEYNISKEDAVLIGDGTSDYYSGLKYDVDTILIPWPEQNPNFNFTELVLDDEVQNQLKDLELKEKIGSEQYISEIREKIKYNNQNKFEENLQYKLKTANLFLNKNEKKIKKAS